MTFVQELKDIIAEKHLLNHPFYQSWSAGTLPQEAMQRYAEQYYHLENNFPKFLSLMHSTCDEFKVRQAITDNMHDEEHGVENHRELWLWFGEEIGTARDAMINSKPIAETTTAVETFKNLSKSSTLEGVAALAAYESQIPEVAGTKIEGLKNFYGIDSEKGTKFFKLHGVMDVTHAQTWWDIIDEFAKSDEEKEEVRKAVTQGRDALWGFLDGIVREYIPETHAELCACEA